MYVKLAEKDNNFLPSDDDLDNIDHIEVRNYLKDKHSSKLRGFFDYFLGATTHTSKAVSDSYSVFSSFASHGVSLSKKVFMGLGTLLTLNYFFTSRRQQKYARSAFKNSLHKIGKKTIPDSQYQLWQTSLQDIGELDLAQNIEDVVKNSVPDELMDRVKDEFKHSDILFNDFIGAVELAEEVASDPNLKWQIDQIKFIHAQIGLNAEHTAEKIKHDKAIQKALHKERYQKPKPVPKTWKEFGYYILRKSWKWWFNNYRDIFSGISLAGTFGSIILSFTGMGIVALFPWNILFAGSLIALTAGGSFASKRYFRHRVSALRTSKSSIKHSIYNKLVLTHLLVNAKQLRHQLNMAFQEFRHLTCKLEEHGVPPVQENVITQAMLRATLQSFKPELTSSQIPQEFIEVTELKAQPNKLRHGLGYLLPTLFAISSGYSFGATLLQLTLFAGISTSLLPFIVIGLACMLGYSAHSIYSSYKLFRSEEKSLDALNHSVLTKANMELLNNQLKLINHFGIIHNQRVYSMERYLKEFSREAIKDNLFDEISAMNAQVQATLAPQNKHIFDQKTREQLQLCQATLLAILTKQSMSLKSKDFSSAIRFQLNGVDELAQEPAQPIKLSLRERGYFLSRTALRFLYKNLRIIAHGTTFGLYTSASLLLIFGAATLFSIQLTAIFLVSSAIVGTSIALMHQNNIETKKAVLAQKSAVKNTINDKGDLAGMLVKTYTARNEIDQIIKDCYRPKPVIVDHICKEKAEMTEKLKEKEKENANTDHDNNNNIDEQDDKPRVFTSEEYTEQLLVAHSLVKQLAKNLTFTLNPNTCRMEGRFRDENEEQEGQMEQDYQANRHSRVSV